jgi:hypothetical protein
LGEEVSDAVTQQQEYGNGWRSSVLLPPSLRALLFEWPFLGVPDILGVLTRA